MDYAQRIRYYAAYGKFPRKSDPLPARIIDYLADQIESPVIPFQDLTLRQIQRRNAEVRKFINLTPMDAGKMEALKEWVSQQSNFLTEPSESIDNQIRQWCLSKQYEPPSNRDNLVAEPSFRNASEISKLWSNDILACRTKVDVYV